MCCANCYCKRSNACALYKFSGFLWIGIGICNCNQIIFLTTYLTKFCLAWDSHRSCYVSHLLAHLNVSFIIQLRTVNHHGSISSLQCLHRKIKTTAMVKVQANRNGSLCSFCCNDCLIGLKSAIFNSRWSSLDHNRCFQLLSCLNDSFHHLHILCIKCTYCVTALLSLQQHFLRCNKWHILLLLPADTGRESSVFRETETFLF